MSRCPSCDHEIVHAKIDYDVKIACPICSAPMIVIGANGVYQSEVPPALAPVDSEWLTLVHSLWRELHEFAFVATDEQWAGREQWFEDWLSRVPQFGCNCQLHFRDLIRVRPPDFSARLAFFLWTVDAHNLVNSMLGKTQMPAEDALRLYERNTD